MGARNNRAKQKNELHNSALANPDSSPNYANYLLNNYAEEGERDLFASDVEEDCTQAGDFIQNKDSPQDMKDARDTALSTNDGTRFLKEGTQDNVQDNSIGDQAEDCATHDTRTPGEAIVVAIADGKDSKDLARSVDIKQDVAERACLTIDNTHVQSNMQVEMSTESNATRYEHKKDSSETQETKKDGINIKGGNKIVPDFMTLVKECVKGKGNYRNEDESDEESSPMRPCFERRGAECEAQSSSSDGQDSVNTKNQIENQGRATELSLHNYINYHFFV